MIYHGLFIVAQVFQVVLCADALYQRNTGNLTKSSINNHPLMIHHIYIAQLIALILFGLLVVGKIIPYIL